MNKFVLTAAATLLGTTAAHAVGLDRSGQDIDVIFEEGDYFEFSLGYIDPSVDGTDLDVFGGQDSGNVADSYLQGSMAYKQQLNDQLSFSLILDQPYGVDVEYPEGVFGDDGSIALGGTEAVLNSTALTGMLRYEFGNGFSVHGGIRGQEINARVRLGGAAYGDPVPAGLDGYEVDLDGDMEIGWQAGFAYERPEIALRVALTYFSEIEFDFESTENFNVGLGADGITETVAPQAVNLSFQTGVAPGTLVFGSIRWADYDDTLLSPPNFAAATGGASLTSIESNYGYTLGVGRQFTDRFAGSVSLTYEEDGEDDLVSPLSPVDGSIGITVGGRYEFENNIILSGGVNYTRVGDAFPETGDPDVARADFDDNDSIAVGVTVGYRF